MEGICQLQPPSPDFRPDSEGDVFDWPTNPLDQACYSTLLPIAEFREDISDILTEEYSQSLDGITDEDTKSLVEPESPVMYLNMFPSDGGR